MDIMENHIGIVPLGSTFELPVKIIAANISGHLNLPVKIFPSIPVPDLAFDDNRMQYNAALLLKKLEAATFSRCNKIICVLGQDLFLPIFTHVYGEARQGGSVALVSLFRLNKNLDGSSPEPELFYERTAKVALHELGHLFNLFHCNEKTCLMHFSIDVKDLDNHSFYFCRYCSAFFPSNKTQPEPGAL